MIVRQHSEHLYHWPTIYNEITQGAGELVDDVLLRFFQLHGHLDGPTSMHHGKTRHNGKCDADLDSVAASPNIA